MARVQVLADTLIDQIAAGEVVERPSSVVKELVENALDAQAQRVDVAIAEGGIRWIRVQDDGSGMSRDDARLAFARHATSKIASPEDLAAVSTLGFRGEALPSIAAVGRVRMRTRRSEDAVGTELVGEGAGIREVREVACAAGTQIEVAELFARLPARRKFLRASLTEAGHVVRWLEHIALARPELRLALERDGRNVLLFLPTANARERAIAVLPPGVGERLLEVEGVLPFARVMGFASPTDVRRGTTNDIHLFVNRRPVRDRLLLFAVREAYRDALPPGRHPAAVLYLEVMPDHVDVNVHPAKWEVRFRESDAMRRLVTDALMRALGRGMRRPAPPRAFDFHDPVPRVADAALEPQGGFLLARASGAQAAGAQPEADALRPAGRFGALHYLGQLLGTYLLFEGPEGLVMLDQHAAHERVLFERLRQAFFGGKVERQPLLFPVRAELARSRADALEAQREALEQAGFELEVGEGGVRGGVWVALRAVPALLAQRERIDWPALLEETAARLDDPTGGGARDGLEAALHHVFATAACHAATRKGDRLLPPEVNALLEALDETIWFPNCPHGRPILSVLGGSELERRFLRR